jgi:S1-C subfamily serine protease
MTNTSGSGFLISDRGNIATNHHVASDCRRITARRGTQLPLPLIAPNSPKIYAPAPANAFLRGQRDKSATIIKK